MRSLYPLLALLAMVSFTITLLRYIWDLRVLSGYSDWPFGPPRGTMKETQAQHDALATHRLDNMTRKLRAAVDIGRTLTQVLPDKFGRPLATAAHVVANTPTTVSDLRKGDSPAAHAIPAAEKRYSGYREAGRLRLPRPPPGQPLESGRSRNLDLR